MKIQIDDLGPGYLGLSAAAQKALADKNAFGVPVPSALEEIPQTAQPLDSHARAALCTNLRAGLSQHGLPSQLEESLRKIGQEGTLAVITGQQPGFLSSPLYSLIKAIQVCRLAEALSDRWQVPVVPLFWNHADDHDIAEVHHSYIQNRNLDLQKVALSGLSSGKEPLSTIRLNAQDQGLDSILSLLEQNFGMYEHAEAAFASLLPRDGETLPGALTRVLVEWLGPKGLIPLEPDWIRESLSEGMARIIESDPGEALIDGSAHGSIPAKGAAILFELVDGERTAWRLAPGGFAKDDAPDIETQNPGDLATAIRNNPAAWSPGALLRPLAQDFAMPVCAYIGGFGELAYHAQLAPVRKWSKLVQTAFIPRVSITLVDTECSASLSKAGVTVREVLDSKGELKPTESEDAPAVFEDIRNIVTEAQNKLRQKRTELAKIEPSLDSGLRRAADQMTQGVEKLLSKAQRIHQNKGGKAGRHLRRLNNRLMPRGIPQERVLGPLEFYARYGPEWLEALYDATPPMCASHLAMTLSDNPAL